MDLESTVIIFFGILGGIFLVCISKAFNFVQKRKREKSK